MKSHQEYEGEIAELKRQIEELKRKNVELDEKLKGIEILHGPLPPTEKDLQIFIEKAFDHSKKFEAELEEYLKEAKSYLESAAIDEYREVTQKFQEENEAIFQDYLTKVLRCVKEGRLEE
ncbi:MAG: hypothetical protein ACFFCQ_18020 [Promethearchaeota archaeon]